MGAGEVDGADARRIAGLLGRNGDIQRAAQHHRLLILADLVALGQIRVEVVLAGKDGDRCDLRADGQPETDGMLDRLPIEHRQGAGQTQVHGAGLGVGLGPESGGGPGKDLGPGQELGMDFQPDHHFPLHERISRISGSDWRSGRSAD